MAAFFQDAFSRVRALPRWRKLFFAALLDLAGMVPLVEYVVAPVSVFFIYAATGFSKASLLFGLEDALPFPFDFLPDNFALVAFKEFFRSSPGARS